MKKVRLTLTMVLVAGLVTGFLQSCKKDETPNPLTVVSVVTDSGIALDGANAVTNIPVKAAFVVTFDKEIDAMTANSASIAILSNGVDVPSTLTVDGSTVTLKPNVELENGTNHTVSVASTLAASDGAPATEAQFTLVTYGRANVVPPQSGNQLSYFSFSGNMNDAVGTHTPADLDVRDLTFNTDRFGFAGLAGDFNGSTSSVEIPNGEQYLTGNSFTLSLWIKANSTKEGQFVLGLGAWKGFHLEIASDWSWIKMASQYSEAGGLSDSEDNWFPGTGETNQNTGWQGWTFHKNVLPHGGGVGTTYLKDKWAHVVCTYEASTKLATMYINGEKVKQHDFDLWPVNDAKRTISGVKFAGNLSGGGNKLALGFIQGSRNRIISDSWADPVDVYSNHFKGLMDDVRIFKVALTASEVGTLHTAEKP